MPPKRAPKSSADRPDPYYTVKQQIEDKMSLLVQDFDRWKYILDKKNTSTDSTFTQLLQDIRFSHKELTNDILQIVKINTHVETHRDRFGHISEDELNNRKGFALEIKGKLNDIDSVINSERTTKKMQEDKDRAAVPIKLKPGQTGVAYVNQRRMEQVQMDDEQDAVLQDMSSALSRLNTNAGTIQNQLHTQTELLEEMDQRLDDNQNLMDVALHKMDAVLNKSTAGKWTIIGIELVIAFVLLALIVI